MASGSLVTVHGPQLDLIPNDPVLSPSMATSQSRSRVAGPSGLLTYLDEDPAAVRTGISEIDPLLGGEGQKQARKKPFYRPRPLWIVPFAVLASISRGMTIAPRVEVFTQLACNAVYGHPPHYNHSTRTHELLSVSHSLQQSAHTKFNPTIISLIEPSSGEEDDDEDDDPLRLPSKRCISDPAVQSYAARLQTIMATTVGFLSALTTGWWGHFGERHGRTRVLAAASFGLLLTDVFFVLVSLPRSPLAAHGHRLLIIAPFLEGLLGGWTTLQGATSAYISDCTSDGSRSHIFSRFMGVFYFGFAIGPMLGAWVITHPPAFLQRIEPASVGRTVTPSFWVAVCFSLTNLLLALFVFPESLGKKKGEVEPRLGVSAAGVVEVDDQASETTKGNILPVLRDFFAPLLVFAPKNRPYGRDWNMTILALALFGYLLSSGIFQLKYLYAEHVFGWETEQLSYYITFVGGARAVHLLFLMPFTISLCKPKPKKSAQQGAASNKKAKPTKSQLIAEMKFDLRIAKISYAIDVLSHTLVSLSSTAPTTAAQLAFVGFTVLSSFGSSVVPGMQSLALCIMQTNAAEDERLGVASSATSAGGLFGALAVLQALGQMILGPMLFGLVYGTTVARFPKAIFVLAAAILLISLLLLANMHPIQAPGQSRGKKVRSGSAYVDAYPHHPYARDGPERERGRSRVSKDLSRNSTLLVAESGQEDRDSRSAADNQPYGSV